MILTIAERESCMTWDLDLSFIKEEFLKTPIHPSDRPFQSLV
jgi:hypothetical protein